MGTSALGSISELSQFIETGEFRYAAQHVNQVDGKSGGSRWFQWLIRPRLDNPSATTEDFIQAVESTDLAMDLDMRVIEDALRWLDRQPSNTRLTINVSSGSFANRLFPSHVSLLINDSTVLPGQLCFGITLHNAIGNLSGATRFIKTVRRLGCQVAVGAGVPGNPVLGLFAPMGLIEYLKIDFKWVVIDEDNKLHRQTLESAVEFGQRMNLNIIADGVDNNTQMEFIRGMGVEYYQGYIDGEPQIVVGAGLTDEDDDSIAEIDRSA
jgi:EAL domain-containing protein (putative c-di-GMP-specific phosphodiesterase class I)